MSLPTEHHSPHDIDVEQLKELGSVEFRQLAVVHVSGIAEKSVETPSMIHRFSNHPRAVSRDGDIADHHTAAVADFGCDGPKWFFSPSRNRHEGSFVGEVQRCPFADSGSSTGDQYRHVFDLAHYVFLLRWVDVLWLPAVDEESERPLSIG
jgi:hypothetical protein